MSILHVHVNALAGALFAYYGEKHQRDKMKEFLVVRRIITIRVKKICNIGKANCLVQWTLCTTLIYIALLGTLLAKHSVL